MLDLGFVRGNLEVVEEKLRARGADPAALLGNFRQLDQRRREAITASEQLKARRNELSQQVGTLKREGKDATAVMDETRALKEKLDELDHSATALDEQMRLALASIPNLTRDEVPVGKSEEDNVTVKTWGEKPQFDFTPKPHWELGEQLGILDLERAAKLSGARFAVYMGAGARLERALIGFMLDMHTQKHGYTEVLPPFMVNSKSLFGTGSFPSLPKTCSAAPTRMPKPLPAASTKTTTTGSSPRPRSPSPISTVTKFSTKPACPSPSPHTLPASVPKPVPRARTRAASSGSISFRKLSWSSSRVLKIPTPNTKS